jgi:hypothetical protein
MNSAFVEVIHPADAPDDVIQQIALSFLFELGSSGFHFTPSSYPISQEFEEDTAAPQAEGFDVGAMRPLRIGPGLEELHSLFVEGCSAQPAEYALIHFVKAIEYVSATVVRMARHDALRKRMSTQQALLPNADFLDGLVDVIEDHRVFNKDSEALRLTLITCCDPYLLVDDAPPFLDKLRNLQASKDAKSARAGIEQFAGALSATRNQLSHAKAAYILTGMECPLGQLDELTVCARCAAEQVIRWYAHLPELSRVT